jgi:hypothetical protein
MTHSTVFQLYHGGQFYWIQNQSFLYIMLRRISINAYNVNNMLF